MSRRRTVVTLGWASAATGLLMVLVTSPLLWKGGVGMLALWGGLLGGCLLLAGGLHIVMRLDPRSILEVLALGAWALALVSGIYVVSADGLSLTMMAVGTCAFVVAVAATRVIISWQRDKSAWPYILQGMVLDGAVELDGVHMAAVAEGAAVAPGGRLDLVLLVQNCWDAPRSVELSVVPLTRVSLNQAGLRLGPVPHVDLGPGDVKELRIPVDAAPEASGRHVLQIQVKVRGERGRRIRHRYEQPYSEHVPTWLTALGAVFGGLLFGGGWAVDVHVEGEAVARAPDGAVSTETLLWRPGL